jgi:hypothetical protein
LRVVWSGRDGRSAGGIVRGPGGDGLRRRPLILQAWLAALDDFRNWLIHEAA